jgi:hypothetical protein
MEKRNEDSSKKYKKKGDEVYTKFLEEGKIE